MDGDREHSSSAGHGSDPREVAQRQSVTERISRRMEPALAAIRRALASPLRTTRMSVVVGRVLGLGLLITFATGVYSHLLQDPIGWLPMPTRPIALYGILQGVHVVVGAALLPLLLAKLWTVYPRLFKWPPITGFASLLERASVGLLVSSAIVMLVTGILNVLQWYPWDFSFRRTHWALAWVLVGTMVIHIAVQLPKIREHWRADREPAAAQHRAAQHPAAQQTEDQS